MKLPLDTRLRTAGQLVVRAKVFYDIWRYFAGQETRRSIFDTMNSYSEFFRFDVHAHLVAFAVHITMLFDRRKDTISLPNLVKDVKDTQAIPSGDVAEIAALLMEAAPLVDKVKTLRDNVFAHRSAMMDYEQAFKEAGVTPNQFGQLTDIALKVANRLLLARGLGEQVFMTAPLAHAQAMMAALSGSEAE